MEDKNQTKILPPSRCSGRDTIPIGHSVGLPLSKKYVVPDLHICTLNTDVSNTPKRIGLKLESFKRSHQYHLKNMKKQGKIKTEGRDFILVPKRDFLNLLQSLCMSVLNTRKMLILQVATTPLVPPRDLCRALPSSHKKLKFFKALAGLESLLQLVMDS